MKVLLDNLKKPNNDICLHCLSISKRVDEPNGQFYKFYYKCDCDKKFGSKGEVYGACGYQLDVELDSLEQRKTDKGLEINEGCGLHEKCNLKDKKIHHYLILTEVGGKFYIENRQRVKNPELNKNHIIK